MNNESATLILRNYLSGIEFYFAENDKYPDDYDEDFTEAIELAIRALKIQTPKPPLNVNEVNFDGSIRSSFKTGTCANCKEYVDNDDDVKCCSKCGQLLNW